MRNANKRRTVYYMYKPSTHIIHSSYSRWEKNKSTRRFTSLFGLAENKSRNQQTVLHQRHTCKCSPKWRWREMTGNWRNCLEMKERTDIEYRIFIDGVFHPTSFFTFTFMSTENALKICSAGHPSVHVTWKKKDCFGHHALWRQLTIRLLMLHLLY